MEFSWPIVIVGTVLGVLQLAVGVVVGRALPWGGTKPEPTEPAADDGPEDATPGVRQLRAASDRLQRLMDNLASDVGRHQVRIEQITKEVSSLKENRDQATSSAVLYRLGEIEQANRHFRQRLSQAEATLRDHTRQIDDHAAQLDAQPDIESLYRDLRSRLAKL